MKTWLLCQSRWRAENYEGGRGLSNQAADLGTVCHLACESYVQKAIVAQIKEPTLKTLLDFYVNAYMTIMKSLDHSTPLFKDGENMMRVWHDRTSFEGFKVISCEVKDSFELPYVLDGQKRMMRFNYIADRVDELAPDEFRVVDYKSWRGVIDADEVRSMLQARVYALAYQIKYRDRKPRRIWVSIDQFRGEDVGYAFTREDSAITYRTLQAYLQEIVDTDPDRVRETLNDECGFCVRKGACGQLKKHADVGGVLGMTVDELVKAKYHAQASVKANQRFVDEVEKRLAIEMNELDLKDLETLSFDEQGEKYKLTTYGNGRSEVDSKRLPGVIGEDVALSIAKYSLGDVRGLKGDPRLPFEIGDWDEQVESLIEKRVGKTTYKVTKLDNKKWNQK